MFRRIYLDHSATTPIDREILDAMIPYLTEKFGNASSIHFFGQEARAAVDKARHQVAEIINARPNEIVFTSGGTESNNLAIRGLVQANEKYGKHIITSNIEHSAVKNVCEDLEKRGYEVTYLPVYEDGIVKIEDIENAIRLDTILVTIMTANNEIGTIQPVEEIGRIVGKTAEKSGFIPTRCRGSGKFRLMSRKSAAICSQFLLINFTRRKAPVLFTSGEACDFNNKISAVIKSATAAVERNPFLISSLLEKHANWLRRIWLKPQTI
jgi:hypothetical protein